MAKKKTHEDFLAELSIINPNIIVLSQYKNAKSYVLCRCKNCDNLWQATPDNLLHKKGCPSCNGGITMPEQEFMAKLSQVNPNIKIISQYISCSQKVTAQCCKCNHIWSTRANHLLEGHGCVHCSHIKMFSTPKDTKKNNTQKQQEKELKENLKLEQKQKQFVDDLLSINPNIIILSPYIQYHQHIKCQCTICHHQWDATPANLLRGRKCPVCSNKVVVVGINDIATTNPEIIDYLVNKEDIYKYTKGSGKIISAKCPHCNYIKQLTVKELVQYGIRCPNCSDNISYPNKFSYAFLSQLPIENHIKEYSPDWIKPRRYDNYFEYQGQAYILEMDGGWHYKDNILSGQTLKETQDIDNYKDMMAEQHDITIIRIDCQKSDKVYIAKNILQSRLNTIFDLAIINWDLCDSQRLNH